MKRIFLLALLFGAACHRQTERQGSTSSAPLPAFSGGVALGEISRFVAIGPRMAGTMGAAKATGYLEQRLTSLGCSPVVESFIDLTPKGSNSFANVMVVMPGRMPGHIILGAHYDTKAGIEGFEGANDSGSGIGLLLALVPLFQACSDRRPTITLVFFDGEECLEQYGPSDGLHGSRRFVSNLVSSGKRKDVTAVIIVDMIGDRNLKVTIPRNGDTALMARLFRCAAAEGVRSEFALYPGVILDDHQPFVEAGIPAIDLIDFDYGSAPGVNDFWHTREDTIDKIAPESLEIVGRVLLRFCMPDSIALPKDLTGREER